MPFEEAAGPGGRSRSYEDQAPLCVTPPLCALKKTLEPAGMASGGPSYVNARHVELAVHHASASAVVANSPGAPTRKSSPACR